MSAVLRSRDGDTAVVGVPDGRGGEELLTLDAPYSSAQFLPDVGETVVLVMSGPVPRVMPDQLAVDAITVRELKAGTVTALLLIGDRIVAGDEVGNHVELKADGVRVYALDLEEGQYEAIRMGTGSDDFWAITTAAGVSVASISSAGAASFSALSSTAWPQIGVGDWTGIGGSLDEILDRRPRGLVGYGHELTGAPATTGTNTVNGIGFFEIVLDLLPGRRYKLCTSDIHIKSTVAGDVGQVRVMQTTAVRGTLPTSAGVGVGNVLAVASGVAGTDVTLTGLLYADADLTVAVTTRLLLTYGRVSGTGLVNIAGRPDGPGEVVMWVEDIGPFQADRAVLNDGGSNGIGGAGGTAPVPPVASTLTVDGSWSNTYDGAGTHATGIVQLRQGKKPVVGDRKSIVGFRELTELVGATVTSVVLRLNATFWESSPAGVAAVGFHNKLVQPTGTLVGVTGITADVFRSTVWAGLGAGFVDLTAYAPQEWATGVKRGVYLGVAQGTTDADDDLVGSFNGPLDANADLRPQLIITYTV